MNWTSWRSPGSEVSPWVRWWWPGNDVELHELGRELEVLADHGFGGVELQAFDAALDPAAGEDEMERRRSVDTAAYFANVKEMLTRADITGIGVDLTLGSGWPTARTDIPLSESMQMLVWGEATVAGGGERTVPLPPPAKPAFYEVADMAAAFGEPMATWLPEQAALVTVLAARVTGGERASNPLVLDDGLELDPKSVLVLTDTVKDNAVTFSPGPGDWLVIAFYRMPDGQAPVLHALGSPAFVINHLDADVVDASLEHWLGKRTGLSDPPAPHLRCVFVDSFELKNERLFTDDLLAEFQSRRGYDLTPLLPAVVLPGADNNMFDGGGLRRRSPFSLGEDDERVRFDYAHTVSDLFIERFVERTSSWSDASLRIQAYGLDADIVRAAALSDIPEAEQLYAGGSELFLRLVSSGAHLSPGPTGDPRLVSAEALVWEARTYMTTPAKVRAAVDKLVAAGINHVVYHGFPYRKTEGYGQTGWHPFCSPFGGAGTFTSNVGEASPFWPYTKQVNDYVARIQTLMRQGEAANGILVYYPFLGASAALVRMEEHDELFFNGHFPGESGGPGANPLFALVDSLFGKKEPPPSAVWLEQAWPTLRSLDQAGHAWDFVSDDIAREGLRAPDCPSVKAPDGDREPCVGGVPTNVFVGQVGYRGILFFQVPHVSPDVAERIADAAEAGVPVVVVGDPPQRQPGFLDHDAGDARVKAAMMRVMAASTTAAVSSPGGAGQALVQAGAIPHLPGFSGNEVRHNIRVGAQEPPSHALHALLFNPEPEPREVSFEWPTGCTSGYWVDAWADRWWPADPESRIEARLPALGSLLFLCNYRPPQPGEGPAEGMPPWAGTDSDDGALGNPGVPILLGPWRLAVEGPDAAGGLFDETLTDLSDWRDVEALRYCSSQGIYTAQLALEPAPGSRYFLRAADVRGAAEVRVNGKRGADLLVPPYVVEVTDLLSSGSNSFEIRLVPPLRNRLVGLAQAGDPDYPQFVTDPERLAPTGLVGTVELAEWPSASLRNSEQMEGRGQ